MNSRRTHPVGLLLLLVILFAQAAVTFAACDAIRSAAIHSTSHEPCHEQGGSTNLCLAHCQAEDLTLDKPQIKIHALLAQPVLTLRAPAAPAKSTGVRPLPEAWAHPPPRILLHRFLV